MPPPMRTLVASLLVLVPTLAHAQASDPRFESRTRGVHVPGGVVAGDADATAVELNPGGLAHVRGLDLRLVAVQMDQATGVRAGAGLGLFSAGRLGPLAMGLGLQWLDPPRSEALDPAATGALVDAFKLSLGFGLGGKHGGIGLAWHHLATDRAPGLDSLDSFDVGASVRPSAYLALGVVARDLNQPRIAADAPRCLGCPIDQTRSYDVELALRPLGDARVELGAGVRMTERTEPHFYADPHFRLRARLFRGVHVRGDLATLRRQWETDAAGAPLGETTDVRATAGLEIDLAHAGVGFATLFGSKPPRGAGGDGLHGYAVTAHASFEEEPSIVMTPYVAKLELGAVSGARFSNVLADIEALTRKPEVQGIWIELSGFSAGFGRIEELRQALARVRASGRKVFVYFEEIGVGGYYLASVADRIVAHPTATLRLLGIGTTALYFKGVLDQLGVRADFVKIDEYKSAPEQFMREGPSDKAREQRDAILDYVSARVVERIGQARKLEPERAQKLILGAPLVARAAKAAGLVDEVRYPDELDQVIESAFGRKVAMGGLGDGPIKTAWHEPRVAIVHVEGDIVDGDQDEGLLGGRLAVGDVIAEAIKQAREDSSVRAIVLRVDSPGGSVLASDKIAREVEKTRGRKPIIGSMGDVAASGGYYVSAPVDRIYAEDLTVTGSIGIFSGKFDASGLLARAGVTWDTSKRGAHADAEGPYRPWTDEERQVLRQTLGHMYDAFLDIVARNRKMTKEQVNAIGRGHVWTGQAAKERGLVDEIGSLTDALGEAKRRAGLAADERVEVVHLPRRKLSLGKLLRQNLGVSESPLAPLLRLPAVRALVAALPASILIGGDGVYARMEWTPAEVK